MARSARQFENGGFYHICTRGNDKRRLFRTPMDYRYLLDLIKKYQQEFKLGMLHYCLMSTHVHFILQAEVALDMPKFMKKILQVYAYYFRRRYHSVGYVFENRYKSKLITNEKYLLECARYLDNNPVRARLVEDASMWKWSSYHYYAFGKPDKVISLCNPVYLLLDKDEELRREYYRKLVAEKRLYEEIVDKEFAVE